MVAGREVSGHDGREFAHFEIMDRRVEVFSPWPPFEDLLRRIGLDTLATPKPHESRAPCQYQASRPSGSFHGSKRATWATKGTLRRCRATR
jgi:hypothetical protein